MGQTALTGSLYSGLYCSTKLSVTVHYCRYSDAHEADLGAPLSDRQIFASFGNSLPTPLYSCWHFHPPGFDKLFLFCGASNFFRTNCTFEQFCNRGNSCYCRSNLRGGVTSLQQSTGLLSQYSQEKCGYCGGQRVTQDNGRPCQPCQGRGIVFVLRPPHVCPRCGGNGRPGSAKELTYNIYYCSVCLGTGWIMTELHVASTEPVE